MGIAWRTADPGAGCSEHGLGVGRKASQGMISAVGASDRGIEGKGLFRAMNISEPGQSQNQARLSMGESRWEWDVPRRLVATLLPSTLAIGYHVIGRFDYPPRLAFARPLPQCQFEKAMPDCTLQTAGWRQLSSSEGPAARGSMLASRGRTAGTESGGDVASLVASRQRFRPGGDPLHSIQDPDRNRRHVSRPRPTDL